MPRKRNAAKEDLDANIQNCELNNRKSKKKETPIAYDMNGHIRKLDICDCLNQKCSGCWNECPNCGANKCGLDCRVNRPFLDDTLTFDGKELKIFNPAISPKYPIE